MESNFRVVLSYFATDTVAHKHSTIGGGRHAPNKRVVIGRFGRLTPEQARRKAQALLGRVASLARRH